MQQGVANEKRKLQMAGNNNIIFPREQKQANENSPDMEVESASYSVCHRTHTNMHIHTYMCTHTHIPFNLFAFQSISWEKYSHLGNCGLESHHVSWVK